MDDQERLRLLYEWAVDLDRSENILRHHWGLHLLSDWKSLSLLVQDDSDEPRAEGVTFKEIEQRVNTRAR